MKYFIFDVGGVLLVNGQINQPLLDICLNLRRQKYWLAIISNYSSIPPELSNLGIFDPIMTYGQTRLLKPNPRLFQKFINITNVIPSDCLFIDDSLTNVSAAQKFGFNAIHYQSLDILKQELVRLLK